MRKALVALDAVLRTATPRRILPPRPGR
jgi:hypothetical protein